ncbi:hypothetical protein QOZ80_3BG0294150 [Eleusine coracana subsp. coracana]|nr:hypothetical protein QOZ80_3BG0294150 [Eleusine coracana subsp. coracana]
MWRRGSSSSKKKTTRAATGEEAAGGSSSQSQPYHECPFCKHGFTTGQALGGHMNVHRRDRAASRRPARDAPAADTASAAAYHQYPLPPPPSMMMDTSFATYYDPGASAAWDATSYYGGAGQTELNLFGAPATATHGHDLQLGVGSRVSGEWGQPDGEAERSLDLELRLGRYPGWQ